MCVASQTKEEHRLHVTSVFTRLAQRQHSIKPSKAHILRRIIEYLGHLSTPNGTKATGKHVQAIVDMPAPTCMADDLVTVDKTKVRSFLGLDHAQHAGLERANRIGGSSPSLRSSRTGECSFRERISHHTWLHVGVSRHCPVRSRDSSSATRYRRLTRCLHMLSC